MGSIWTRTRRSAVVVVTAACLISVPFVLEAGAASSAAPAIPTQVPVPGGGGPGPDNEGSGVAAPVDPAASALAQQALRPGKPAGPRTQANRGGFTVVTPATFPDGVSVRVVKVTKSVEQGAGPGVFKGRPHTALTLSLTNGSRVPLDLTQVVVTTTYGSPALVASPVYEDPSAADFTGTVAPGITATATYVFAVPPGQVRSAVTTVDFDNAHAAATFTGLS